LQYIRDEATVIYQSKDGREEKIFDALERLAAICSHVPDKGEQMVSYGISKKLGAVYPPIDGRFKKYTPLNFPKGSPIQQGKQGRPTDMPKAPGMHAGHCFFLAAGPSRDQRESFT